jgi:hypothetical protein
MWNDIQKVSSVRLEMRRGSRRPLTTKRDGAVIPAAQSPSRACDLQNPLTRLSVFVHHFESALPALRETSATLNKLSSDVISLSQHQPTSTTNQSALRDVAQTWISVKSRLPGIVSDINSIDLVDLASNEFESLERIIDEVNDKPPTIPALSKDHRNAHKHLTASIKQARNHLADNELGPFQNQLRTLRNEVSHEYETFFRLSQVEKSRKAAIVDDCRGSLERLATYGELWNEIGSVRVPEFLAEITSGIDELTSAGKRPNSLIPRMSPRSRDQKTPNIARSASARSSSVSNVPNGKNLKSQSVAGTPREPPKRNRAGSVTREEPKRRTARSASAASQSSTADPFFSELREFEKRLDRHHGAIIANDRLRAFMSELRALQKFRRREPHLTKLKALMGQIGAEIAGAQPLSQLEERFKEANTALVVAKRQLQEVKVPNARRLAEEMDLLSAAMRSIPPNPQRKACDGVSALVAKILNRFSTAGAGHQSLVAEMKAVQSRINALRAERGRAAPKDRHEIDAELGALMAQQTDIVEMLAAQEKRS